MSYFIKKINNESYEVAYKLLRLNTYPNETDLKAMNWLFVLHTLNFSLWNRKDSMQWTINGMTGYNALATAIKRAIDVSILVHFWMT